MVDFALNSVVQSIGVSRYTCLSCLTGGRFRRNSKFSHAYIEAPFALLMRTAKPWYCNSFSSASATNASGISRRWKHFRKNYLVAMARSLDKLENKLQIHHLHVKCFHRCKDCENRSSRSGDIQLNTPVFGPCCTRRSQMSSVNSGVTVPNFTKFSHDIQALFALLIRTLR